MEVLYLLYGENEFLINEFIDGLIRDNNIDSKIAYNYNECKIGDVLEEAGYLDLFGNKKLIVLNECDFLTSKSTLEDKSFDNYIKNPNPDTILVLKVIVDKLDERKKIVKSLKECSTLKEFKLPTENGMEEYIVKYFKERDFAIETDALREIVHRLIQNPKVLQSELDKLVLFKADDKHISFTDVTSVVIKYEENNLFKLVDAVVKRDHGKMFKLYKELISNKEEPSVILIMLANQFRLMYQVNVLAHEGMDRYKIATKLKEHPYRVGLALDNSRDVSEKELLNILNSLSLLDFKIKTGEIDRFNALETFFLEL